MKARFLCLVAYLAVLILAHAKTTAFSYQGQLNDAGNPANGSYDLTIQLFDAATNGNAVSGVLTNLAVGVTNGVFSVQFDFGASVFDGSDRWLEIGVRTNGSASAFTILSPRQEVLPTPYAIYANSAGTAAVVPAVNLSGTVGLSQLPSVLVTNGQNGVVLKGTFVGNGGGLTNVTVGGALNWQVISGTNVQAASQNGYLTTASGQVTVTLPASPNVGDVIRVAGTGGGGWTVAQNPGQSILLSTNLWGPYLSLLNANSNGGSYTSYLLATNNTTLLVNYLASSADGARLIAASTNGHLYTSGDNGVTWTERATNLSNPYWHGVASSADGAKLVVVAYGGQIYTSSDAGANWTARFNTNNWTGVASSADGADLIAVAYNDFVYQSTNSGVDWVKNPSLWNGDPESWWAVASSADGSTLFLSTTNGFVSWSTNGGASFTGGTTTGSLAVIACSADGTKVFVVSLGGQQFWVSYDSGMTWTNSSSFLIGANSGVACSADGSRVVAVGGYQINASFDSGRTWTYQLTSTSDTWMAVALSADGTRMVIAKAFNLGGGGRIFTGSTFATVPGTLGSLSGNQYSAVELLYVGNGEFLPVSYTGILTPH